MFATNLTTATIALLVVLAVAVPAAAAGGSADAGGTAAQSITATIATTEDGTVLTLEQDGDGYADAAVDVEAVGGASYEGSGSYETDADGSVVLPVPDEDVSVRLSVETDDARASAVVTLQPYEGNESTRTVEVAAGGGADVSAEGESGRSGDGESSARSGGSFGAEVSAFVDGLLGGVTGFGQSVAEFARENNPASADDASIDAEAGAGAAANGSGAADVEAGAADAAGGASAEADVDSGSNASIDAGASGEVDSDVATGEEASGSVKADAEANGSVEVGALFGLLG